MNNPIDQENPSNEEDTAITQQKEIEVSQENREMELLKIQADKSLAQLEAIYNILPHEHPVALHAQKIWDSISEKADCPIPTKLHILQNNDGIAAFVMPNGAVCISVGLLNTLKTDDQIAALFAHELTHVKQGHFSQLANLGQVKDIPGYLNRLGTQRLQESEADILSTVNLLKGSSYHPLAGASLMQELQTALGKDSWDPEHGGLLDRRLNILMLVNVMDLETAGRMQTPIPDEVHKEIQILMENTKTSLRFDKQAQALEEVQDYELDRLVNAMKEGLNLRSWMLAGKALSSWHQQAITEFQAQKRWEALGDEYNRQPKIETSPRGRVISNTRFAKYQRAGNTVISTLDSCLEKTIPDRATRTAFIISACTNAFSMQLFTPAIVTPSDQSKIEFIDFRQADGIFLSEILNEELIDTGIEYLEKMYDPALWKAHGIDVLYVGTGEKNLISLIQYADRVPEAFEDIDSDEGGLSLNAATLDLPKLVNTFSEGETALSIKQNLSTDTLTTEALRLLARRHPDNAEALVQKLKTDNQPGRAIAVSSEIERHQSAQDQDIRAIFYNKNTEWSVLQKKIQTWVSSRGAEAALKEFIDFISLIDKNDVDIRVIAIALREIDSKIFATDEPEERLINELFELAGKIQYIEDYLHLCTVHIDNHLIGNRFPGGQMPDTERQRLFDFFTKMYACKLELTNQDCEVSSDLVDIIFPYALYEITSYKGNIQRVAEATARWEGYVHNLISAGLITSAGHSYLDVYLPNLEKVQQLLASLPFDKENLHFWKNLGSLFLDKDLYQKLESYIHECDAEGAEGSYEDFLEVALPKDSLPRSGNLIERLVENYAETPSHFRQINERLLSAYSRVNNENIGTASIIDGFLHNNLKNSPALLRAAIKSNSDETELCALIFDSWWSRVSQMSLILPQSHFDELETIDPSKQEEWAMKPLDISTDLERSALLQDSYGPPISPQQIIQRLYQMTSLERNALTRKILTNEQSGILMRTSRATGSLKEYLLENLDSGSEGADALELYLTSFLECATVEEEYMLTGNEIAAASFVEPPTRSDRYDMVQKRIKKDYPKFFENNLPPGGSYKTEGDIIAARIYNHAFPSETLVDNWAEQAILAKIPRSDNEPTEKKSIVGLIKIIATGLGAPGVRFLQMLGQYVEINESLQREFSEVYDAVKGQSKLSAYQTISREIPNLISENDRLQQRLGGGSLMTVYKLQKEEVATPLVVKVLNPNAEYRVGQTMDLARRMVDTLIEKEPQNKLFSLIRDQILPDLEEWLMGDINDERFQDLDSHFHQKWTGFTQEGNDFSIYVPTSLRTDSQYIKLEEEVNGKNLTQWTTGDETSYENATLNEKDNKDMYSLIVKQYLYQIMDGVIHSDIHPGNFRITPDNKIAILDRNFYLELVERDRQMIIEAMTSNPVEAILGRIFELEENVDKAGQKEDILRDITQKISSENLTNPTVIGQIVVDLKRMGIKIPLRFSLLAKNLNALNRMAVSAGFSGIVEAMQY